MKRRRRRQTKRLPAPVATTTATTTTERPAIIWAHDDKPYYIAVSEHGYGCHQTPAAAIILAQDEVPAKAKRSQLLIYQSFSEIEPIGWKNDTPVWANGTEPKLVGLTNTHQLFVQSYKGRVHT